MLEEEVLHEGEGAGGEGGEGVGEGDGEGDGDEESEEMLEDPEWVQVMKRHRVAAGRLELLASGVGVGVGAGGRGTLLSPIS